MYFLFGKFAVSLEAFDKTNVVNTLVLLKKNSSEPG